MKASRWMPAEKGASAPQILLYRAQAAQGIARIMKASRWTPAEKDASEPGLSACMHQGLHDLAAHQLAWRIGDQQLCWGRQMKGACKKKARASVCALVSACAVVAWLVC